MTTLQIILVILAVILSWIHGSWIGYQAGYNHGKTGKPSGEL